MPPRLPVDLDYRIDDVLELRKPHPCGSQTWRVVRLGHDIGLRCAGCGRKVLLPRSELAKRVKAVISRGPPADAEAV